MSYFISDAYAQAGSISGGDLDTIFLIVVIILMLFVLSTGYKKYSESRISRFIDQANAYKMNEPVDKDESVEGVPPEAKIFISYRRNDSAGVSGRIYDRLVVKFGRSNVFKDVDSVPMGSDFRDHVEECISKSNVMLVIIIGTSWLGDTENESFRLNDPLDYPRLEVTAAFNKNIAVIPVLVLGADIPNENVLPPEIRALSYRSGVRVRPDPDFGNDIDRLVAGIRNLVRKI